MKLNFNFKQSLYALLLMTSFSGCTSETEFQTNAGGEELTSQSGIRFVIQTPSPDAIVSRATLPADAEESSVKSMSLYIFALNEDAGDTDDNYTLLKKREGITFESTGVPGTSGSTGADGELSYTEPITADMIGRQVKMLLVANDKVADATENNTTLSAFKLSAASQVASDASSSDVISGNIFAKDNASATGLVMSAVAYQGETEGTGEAVVLTPLGVDMKADFERIVARIDLIHAIPNMTLTGVRILNASSKGYLFDQGTAATHTEAATISLTPTSGYTDKLSAGITYNIDDQDHNGENVLKHMFYLYEQGNSSDKCVTVEISYKLKMGNWIKPGKLNVEFKKSDAEGGEYVNTVRNTLYTIQMGDGKEATDVNNVTTIKVLDWNLENEIEEPFTPDEDSHSEIITDPAKAEIGDFYMADGTLRKSDYKFMESEKSQVIGVVFQTYANAPDRFGEAEKQALSEKGVDIPHGLVMAVKEANNGDPCAWKNAETDNTELMEIATLKDAYEDISGFANYKALMSSDGEFADYPAFKAVVDFDKQMKTPEKSTGWFLPSIGQWWDIVANLGLLKTEMVNQQTDAVNFYWFWRYEGSSGSESNSTYINKDKSYVQSNINTSLIFLGIHADKFNVGAYWTSSQYSNNGARHVSFSTTYFDMNATGKTKENYVRPILAF